tara:strand:+ start:2016 stop:2156 length:141 start_codon:yes stop_codon:yes gene_type:complete
MRRLACSFFFFFFFFFFFADVMCKRELGKEKTAKGKEIFSCLFKVL